MCKEILKNILMQEDVVTSVNDNLDELINVIPEIKDMIGFDHKHPHHHLDVFNHTLLALSRAPLNFEIRLVLLLHDIGKPHSYQEGEIRHFKNHPLVSSKIAYNILKRLQFEDSEIEEMCYLIGNHDSILTSDEMNDNKELSKKRFEIQLCDALAHHPDKLERRIRYLLSVNDRLNVGEEKYMYSRILNEFSNKKR